MKISTATGDYEYDLFKEPEHSAVVTRLLAKAGCKVSKKTGSWRSEGFYTSSGRVYIKAFKYDAPDLFTPAIKALEAAGWIVEAQSPHGGRVNSLMVWQPAKPDDVAQMWRNDHRFKVFRTGKLVRVTDVPALAAEIERVEREDEKRTKEAEAKKEAARARVEAVAARAREAGYASVQVGYLHRWAEEGEITISVDDLERLINRGVR